MEKGYKVWSGAVMAFINVARDRFSIFIKGSLKKTRVTNNLIKEFMKVARTDSAFSKKDI